MHLSNAEKETVIQFDEAGRTASVYTYNPALKKQLQELCRTRPEQVRRTAVSSWDGMSFEIPKRWIRITPPRILSPAQRAVLDRINEKRTDSSGPDD